MKNLDTSIANQGILDESFSNVFGIQTHFPSSDTIHSSPSLIKTENPTSIISGAKDFFKGLAVTEPTSNSRVITKPTLTTISAVNKPNPTTESLPTEQFTPTYGGGGGGSGLDGEDSVQKESNNEKMLFGFKAKYVYGAAALGLATFVYFKFIKK